MNEKQTATAVRGRIKWFDPQKGFGLVSIIGQERPIRVEDEQFRNVRNGSQAGGKLVFVPGSRRRIPMPNDEVLLFLSENGPGMPATDWGFADGKNEERTKPRNLGGYVGPVRLREQRPG